MTISAASIVLLTYLAQAAPGQDDRSRAQALLDEGELLYREGDHASALRKFEAAYAAFPSAELWFNIAQAHRALGRPAEALESFERFASQAADAPADKLADARRSIVELQSRLGRIRIECDLADAIIALDGRTLGPAPLAEPVWATPGRHQISATPAGGPSSFEYVDVVVGGEQTILVGGPGAFAWAAPPPAAADITPALGEPATISAGRGRGWWLGRKWTWVAAGSAALLAGTAATVGGLAKARFDDLDHSCGSSSPAHQGCSEGDIDSLQRRMTAANVLWGLAGAAAVTAGVLFFVEDRPLAVFPTAGGAMARVRF